MWKQHTLYRNRFITIRPWLFRGCPEAGLTAGRGYAMLSGRTAAAYQEDGDHSLHSPMECIAAEDMDTVVEILLNIVKPDSHMEG